MAARPESEFPTIADVRDRLSELVDQGFGALPTQALLVPDSTIQAIASAAGHPAADRPAHGIDLAADNGRMAVLIMTVDRLNAAGRLRH